MKRSEGHKPYFKFPEGLVHTFIRGIYDLNIYIYGPVGAPTVNGWSEIKCIMGRTRIERRASF